MSAIDGVLGDVRFDPEDPASIETAIRNMEGLIDERLGQYATNPVIGPLAESMKHRYREGILEKAAATRLEGGQASGE